MDDFQKLLNLSYRFLTIRPRSEQEVKQYLLVKCQKLKVESKAIDLIIQKLKEQKFLDDKAFVRFWIEQRSKIKPKSMWFIKFELTQKGVDKNLIEEVLDDKFFEPVSDYDKALALAKKRIERLKNDTKQKQYEKLGRFLASKGFNYEVIKKVIEKMLPKRYNTD